MQKGDEWPALYTFCSVCSSFADYLVSNWLGTLFCLQMSRENWAEGKQQVAQEDLLLTNSVSQVFRLWVKPIPLDRLF